MSEKYLKILVIGRPNVGKTSIINRLCESRLRVGNFAGVTTGLQSVMIENKGCIYEFIDLPGFYSISNCQGEDEKIAVEILKNTDKYDIILNIIDCTKIELDLQLTKEIVKSVKKPMILCLNMCHIAEKSGIFTGNIKRENVLSINRLSDISKLEFLEKIDNAKIINEAEIATEITDKIVVKNVESKFDISKFLDKIFLNKIAGLPIFLLIMFVIFKTAFGISDSFKEITATLFDFLSNKVQQMPLNREISSFLSDGILRGFLGFIEFLPSIAVLFFAIGILEKSGYMMRISFIMDTIMKFFGLSGRAIIPLVTGFGCSIPAYLSARILPNKVQKIATMFAIGFMTCSAKFTFFIMLVGVFFEKSVAPYVMLGIYIFSALIGLFVAFLIGKVLKNNQNTLMQIFEMPSYKIPNPVDILRYTFSNVKIFLKKAGGFILICSCVIWILANYPVRSGFFDENLDETRVQILQKERLENSILGKSGKIMEPIFAPIGFDWRMNIAAFSGLLGKEVGIVTMGILYGFDAANLSDEDLDARKKSAQSRIKRAISLPSALSMIAFFMLYLPCISATATFKKESQMRYATLSLVVITSLLAWVFAFCVYKISTIFI
ncbi:ferrous iron transporter B [Candidatus Deianiraea vastatrix]|uniref:Ferrous iron transport protein B n=1 Tax=Candidatus Deianiraea vastatrix TaxID=2163644 RepID=A0A5B8XIJ0_9RICK|nr:ferrous iron transporter B [Candidatus Deianiraea vastatrix]QED23794.1 Ferrous iron transport protein B [Candidatus Deianiraea vastatrix]